MEAQRKRQAEAFARQVMGDPMLAEGFKALCEGLEWAAFERWRQTPMGEGWRLICGELVAIRGLMLTVRTVGGMRDE